MGGIKHAKESLWLKQNKNKGFMREKVRTTRLNGAFGLSLDPIHPCSSPPPCLGLLNVDSSNKERILCLDLLLLRPHFPLHPFHFLFLHSCGLYPDYLLKLSFTFVLTTGHLSVPWPSPTTLKSRFFTNSPFSCKTKQKPSLNLKSHFPHKTGIC